MEDDKGDSGQQEEDFSQAHHSWNTELAFITKSEKERQTGKEKFREIVNDEGLGSQYICHIGFCLQMFPNNTSLSNHITFDHYKDRELQPCQIKNCDRVEKGFDCHSRLVSHYKSCHPNDKPPKKQDDVQLPKRKHTQKLFTVNEYLLWYNKKTAPFYEILFPYYDDLQLSPERVAAMEKQVEEGKVKKSEKRKRTPLARSLVSKSNASLPRQPSCSQLLPLAVTADKKRPSAEHFSSSLTESCKKFKAHAENVVREAETWVLSLQDEVTRLTGEKERLEHEISQLRSNVKENQAAVGRDEIVGMEVFHEEELLESCGLLDKERIEKEIGEIKRERDKLQNEKTGLQNAMEEIKKQIEEYKSQEKEHKDKELANQKMLEEKINALNETKNELDRKKKEFENKVNEFDATGVQGETGCSGRTSLETDVNATDTSSHLNDIGLEESQPRDAEETGDIRDGMESESNGDEPVSLEGESQEIVTLKSELEALGEKNKELEESVKSLKAQLVDHASVKSVEMELWKVCLGIEEMSAKLVQARKDREVLEKGLSEIEGERGKLRVERDKAKSDREDLVGEIERLKRANEETESEKKQLESDLEELKSRNCNVVGELERVKKCIQEIESEKMQLDSDLEKVEKERKEIADKVHQAKKINDEISIELEITLSAKDSVDSQLKSMELDRKGIEDKLGEEIEKERAAMRAGIEKEKAEMRAGIEKEKADLVKKAEEFESSERGRNEATEKDVDEGLKEKLNLLKSINEKESRWEKEMHLVTDVKSLKKMNMLLMNKNHSIEIMIIEYNRIRKRNKTEIKNILAENAQLLRSNEALLQKNVQPIVISEKKPASLNKAVITKLMNENTELKSQVLALKSKVVMFKKDLAILREMHPLPSRLSLCMHGIENLPPEHLRGHLYSNFFRLNEIYFAATSFECNHWDLNMERSLLGLGTNSLVVKFMVEEQRRLNKGRFDATWDGDQTHGPLAQAMTEDLLMLERTSPADLELPFDNWGTRVAIIDALNMAYWFEKHQLFENIYHI